VAGIKGQHSNLLTVVPPRNADDFLAAMDRRCKAAKMLTARLYSLMQDLGGIENLSYQQRSLCKRAVHLEGIIETWELEMTEGKSVDVSVHTQALNSLIGLYRHLGLKRVARDVRLKDVLQGNAA